jgi:hypothetical protein
MKLEDIKIGMQVRAITKTYMSKTLGDFLVSYPNRIATVEYISCDGVVDLRSNNAKKCYKFYPQDLEPIYGVGSTGNACSNVQTSLDSPVQFKIKSRKQITIHSLFEAGACEDQLKKFAQHFIDIDPCFSWQEIDANEAQRKATSMGFPNWLIDYGFIEKIPVQVIKSVIISNYDDHFLVYVRTIDGVTWDIFEIFKNGSGFRKCRGIADSSGLTTVDSGSLVERGKPEPPNPK